MKEKLVYKIKKLLVIFKDTTMNQSVMPYDSSCYVNVARRLGHSGFIDALIQHGDNQVVKNLFMNSYKGDVKREIFRLKYMNEFKKEIIESRKKTCCELKPSETVISNSFFKFHGVISCS